MRVQSPPHSCQRSEASVPADARFCASYGQPITVSRGAADAMQVRLSASGPAPLIEKMRTARITGEGKPVTALFADVVGSTTLAEQMDPEDWTAMMNEAFELMSTAVFRYEGTIAQLQRDAILAFFGSLSPTRTTLSGRPSPSTRIACSAGERSRADCGGWRRSVSGPGTGSSVGARTRRRSGETA